MSKERKLGDTSNRKIAGAFLTQVTEEHRWFIHPQREERWRRIQGDERLRKFSSDCFNFLSKSGSKIVCSARIEDGLDVSGRRDNVTQPFPGTGRDSSPLRKFIKRIQLSMERCQHR